MPTGYTATLMEKGQSFNEFIIGCAHAFGALVMLRDEPMDTPIPEFKPSEYYVKAAEEAPKKLKKLLNMKQDARIEYGKGLRSEAIGHTKKYLAKEKEENKRLEEMEKLVDQWTPPTSEHVNLKKFMIEQLEMSRNNTEYSEKQLASYEKLTDIDFYLAEVKSVERDVVYYKEELDKEIKRTNERNQWVKDLKSSLKL